MRLCGLPVLAVLSLAVMASALASTKRGDRDKHEESHLAPKPATSTHAHASPAHAAPSPKAAFRSKAQVKGQTVTYRFNPATICTETHPSEDDNGLIMNEAKRLALAELRRAEPDANIDDDQVDGIKLNRAACEVVLYVPWEPSSAQVYTRLRALVRREPAANWDSALEHSSVTQDADQRAVKLVMDTVAQCGEGEDDDALKGTLQEKMAAELSSLWHSVRKSRIVVAIDIVPRLVGNEAVDTCEVVFAIDLEKPYLPDTEIKRLLVAWGATAGPATGLWSWKEVIKTANTFTGLRMTDENGVGDERSAPAVPWDLLLTGGSNRLRAVAAALFQDLTLVRKADIAAAAYAAIKAGLADLIAPEDPVPSDDNADMKQLIGFYAVLYARAKQRAAATINTPKAVVVAGAGPSGLTAALHAWAAGAASVTVLEKRTFYSRSQKVSLAPTPDAAGTWHNVAEKVLYEWGFEEQLDRQAEFAVRGGTHIKIQHLERFLTKVAMIIGVTVKFGRQFVMMCPPNAASADWRAIHYPSTPTNNPGLLAPVYGATDNGRNVHTLYNLHCVAGDANNRAAEPADVIIGAEGTTGSLRESLRIPFTAATTFSLHTLNNKAPPGGGNIAAPSLTLLFRPGPGFGDKCPSWASVDQGRSSMVEAKMAQISWSKGVPTGDQCSLSMLFRKNNAAHAALLAQVAARPDFFNAAPDANGLDYAQATNPWKLLVDLLRTVFPDDIKPLNARGKGVLYTADTQGIKDLADDLIDLDLNRVLRRVSVFTIELRQAGTHAGRLSATDYVAALNANVVNAGVNVVDAGIATRASTKNMIYALVGDEGRDAVYRFGIGVNDAGIGVIKLQAQLTNILKANTLPKELEAVSAYNTEATARVAGMVNRQAASVAYEGMCATQGAWVDGWLGETANTNPYAPSADSYNFKDADGEEAWVGAGTEDAVKTRFGVVLAACFP